MTVDPLDPIASPCMVAEVLRASLLLGLVGLVLATPVVVGAAGYWTLGWRALSRIALEEGLGGMPGHAGAFETSLLLHLEPEVVRLERAQDTPPEATGPDHPASLPWVETHGWVESLHGYSPGVRRASAVIGQRLFTTIIEATATWLAEFARREAPSPAPSGRTRNGRSL